MQRMGGPRHWRSGGPGWVQGWGRCSVWAQGAQEALREHGTLASSRTVHCSVCGPTGSQLGLRVSGKQMTVQAAKRRWACSWDPAQTLSSGPRSSRGQPLGTDLHPPSAQTLSHVYTNSACMHTYAKHKHACGTRVHTLIQSHKHIMHKHTYMIAYVHTHAHARVHMQDTHHAWVCLMEGSLPSLPSPPGQLRLQLPLPARTGLVPRGSGQLQSELWHPAVTQRPSRVPSLPGVSSPVSTQQPSFSRILCISRATYTCTEGLGSCRSQREGRLSQICTKPL